MKLLKNKEVITSLILQLVIGVIASVAGFLFNDAAGVMAASLSVVFIVSVYFSLTYSSPFGKTPFFNILRLVSCESDQGKLSLNNIS